MALAETPHRRRGSRDDRPTNVRLPGRSTPGRTLEHGTQHKLSSGAGSLAAPLRRQCAIADEHVVGAFVGERTRVAVAGDEGGVVAQGPELGDDGFD